MISETFLQKYKVAHFINAGKCFTSSSKFASRSRYLDMNLYECFLNEALAVLNTVLLLLLLSAWSPLRSRGATPARCTSSSPPESSSASRKPLYVSATHITAGNYSQQTDFLQLESHFRVRVLYSLTCRAEPSAWLSPPPPPMPPCLWWESTRISTTPPAWPSSGEFSFLSKLSLLMFFFLNKTLAFLAGDRTNRD